MEDFVSTVSNVAEGVKKAYDIAFPNLGIFINTLKNTIKIGNFTIAYYGIIIAIGMLVAFAVVTHLAKKLKISEDYFYDLFIIIILLGIIGARAYYVIFNWDYYQIRPYEILNIRGGGLAVFGGIILSFIGVAIYCLVKKCNFLKLVDLSVIGLVIGQAIGRYGNFFNMEAYGGYTNNIFAMRMNMQYLDRNNLDLMQLANIIEENGASYIQAHPTFFYESTFNIILFILLIIIFHKFYKFAGQLLATYLIGYGIIRFFVESFRTDSLMIGNFRVSQIVSIICVLIGVLLYILYFTGMLNKIDSIKLNDKKAISKKNGIMNVESKSKGNRNSGSKKKLVIKKKIKKTNNKKSRKGV